MPISFSSVLHQLVIFWNQPKSQRYFNETNYQRDPNGKIGQAKRKQQRAIPKEDVIENDANGQRDQGGIGIQIFYAWVDQNDPTSKENEGDPNQEIVCKRKRCDLSEKIFELRPSFLHHKAIDLWEGGWN